MYLYLYDSFLNNKKYSLSLTKIENRLIDLGINGKIEKLNVLKSINEVVINNVKSGVDTIVAVGNDETFIKMINIIASQATVTLGFIPVEESLIGRFLGLPLAWKACDVLSGRIIEKIDLGKVNNHYFFSALDIPTSQLITIECNGGRFKINSLNQNNLIQICNLSYTQTTPTAKKYGNPKDGRLEAIFTPTYPSFLGNLFQ